MEPAPRTNSLSVAIFSFGTGIFFASFLSVPPLVSLFLIFLALAIFGAYRIGGEEFGKELRVAALILICASLGALRFAIKDFHEVQAPLSTGVVISEIDDKDTTRQFVFQSDNEEKALVSVPMYTEVHYGDYVRIEGKFERPKIFDSFDYPAYLSKDDIYWTANFAHVDVVSHGNGNAAKTFLLNVKGNFIAQAKRILPEPQASLLMGLLVSGREALPKDILEEFRRAGVIHIVVLSGFNITIVAEFLRKLIQKVFVLTKLTAYPQAAAGAALAGIWLFTLMTGATATVARAAVMATVALSAKFFGRTYSASRALVFAAFIMLVFNPKLLVFDPSFQLSFLATLGLILFMEPVKKRIGFITEKYQLREVVAQTVATQLMVLPFLIYSVGDVSLVSLPANILIFLFVPWTMLAGFIAVLLSYASVIIAWPVTYFTHLLLTYILFVAHALGTLPFAVLAVPHVSAWMVACFYLFLFLFLFRAQVEKVRALRKLWADAYRRFAQ